MQTSGFFVKTALARKSPLEPFPYTDRDRRVPVAKKPVYFQ